MATWPSDPIEIARWVAALTSPSTPGVRPDSVHGSGGAPVAGTTTGPTASRRAPSPPSPPPPGPPPPLTATVDLECPYLR